MMLGEHHRPNPTIHVPPWTQLDTDDLTAEMFYSSGAFNANGSSAYSPVSPTYHHHLHESPTALQRYLQSNDSDPDSDPELSGREADAPIDAYSCDHFRMYEFKVRKCARGRSHDWTECPYAHPGEKARRRDPRKYHYSGSSCPEFRKGNCVKGDACELAHGVFESWLHPARYRTQPCKDGTSCRRRVCFFAHTPDQLRILPHSYDGSGSGLKPFLASSLSVSPPMSPLIESPPMSPLGRLSFGSSTGMGTGSISEMVASLRNIQLGKVKSLPSSRNVQFGGSSPVFGTSPRGSLLRPGFYSLPTTPTQGPSRNGFGYSDMWDPSIEEEPEMELVESGRDLREKMLEKIKMESSMMCPDPSVGAPDVGWVSELLQ